MAHVAAAGRRGYVSQPGETDGSPRRTYLNAPVLARTVRLRVERGLLVGVGAAWLWRVLSVNPPSCDRLALPGSTVIAGR